METNGFPYAFPTGKTCFPMVFPWEELVPLCFSHGTKRVSSGFSHGKTWFPNGFPMEKNGFAYAFPHGKACFPMVFPHGFVLFIHESHQRGHGPTQVDAQTEDGVGRGPRLVVAQRFHQPGTWKSTSFMGVSLRKSLNITYQ